jgi:very-short-patch-repair endonuclease
MLDVAADARPRELERIIARAQRADILDIDALRDRVHHGPRRPGMPLLRVLLDPPGSPAFTRSPAEDRFLELIRTAGLPEPQCNVVVAGRELDFFWEEHGVAVEVDGFAYHRSRHSFESDRDRDLALAARGTDVHRVTWRQIENEPLVVVRRLAAILTRAEVQREGGPK